MKLRQLQHYLDLIKWRESERRGYDMCEKYARCRFCNRHTPNPCAVAYLKWKDAKDKGENVSLSAGQFPEPDLPEKFDAESVARAVASYEKPLAKPAAKPAAKSASPSARVSSRAEKKQSVLTLKVSSDGELDESETRLFVLNGENAR